MKPDIAVVIPSWNAIDEIGACLDSLRAQTVKHVVYVVENGSTDGSVEFIGQNYPEVVLLLQPQNLGFAGGVNVGIRRAMADNCRYIALFNNDAVADKHWLASLHKTMTQNDDIGAVACTLLNGDGSRYDSTGDFYSHWGLAFPRDRDVSVKEVHREGGFVFGASGGASLYRVEMFEQVGLFDEDFFAYYEDVDISFRMQLYGWKVMFEPSAKVYHHTGTTSGKIPGFGTYQMFKNVPFLLVKNVPGRLLPGILLRFWIAQAAIYTKAVIRGRGWPATKGLLRMLTLLPKKLVERRRIQKNRNVSVAYIRSIIVWDLPPNASALRSLRRVFTPWRHSTK
jgi:GT2 family glycosyltransferase